jgi:heterodisulfide reductase subunit B2
MKFALFLGCNIPARLKQYEMSSRAVFEKLGIDVVDMEEFNCCGYPLRNIDYPSSVLSAARNMALAEKRGLNMMVLCMCGFGMFKEAKHRLRESDALREEINGMLAKEGLEYQGKTEIRHILSVLYHDVGLDAIREKVVRPYKDVRIATHYGCHALRPSDVVMFDDPVNPELFDRLVEVTGAKSVYWESRLDCCGAPLFGINDELSMDLTRKKIINATESGADYLCDSCTYCHMQFDSVQRMMVDSGHDGNHALPAVLYTQLLGLSLGIDGETLGLGYNRIGLSNIEGCF